MTTTKRKKKADPKLTEGLPDSFTVTIDWDRASEQCQADRRNCAVHNGLKGRRDITRISVGLDEINFIWRGDARLAVHPTPAVQKVIAKNDLAAAGEIPWPTGVERVRVDLSDVQVKRDLRAYRTHARKARERNPETKRADVNRYREAMKKLDYAERMKKKAVTEQVRGRLV